MNVGIDMENSTTQRVIILIDDSAICREGTADILRREGFIVHAFASGEHGLESLAKDQNVDLILLDLTLPGMDGFAVLEALRRNPLWVKIPVLMLTASESKEDIVRAAGLGVKGFLLKSRFTVDLLMTRIRSALDVKPPGAAPSPESACTEVPEPEENQIKMLTRAETKAGVERFVLEKTLSGSVAEVLAVTTSSHANLMELIQIIKRDIVLGTRVLQLANSAAYASNVPTTTLDDAVRIVGLKAVRNIAMSVGFFERFPPTAQDGFNLIHYWRHSFAVAQLIDWILPTSEAVPGIGYVVGLCHDLSELALQQSLSKEYASALHEAECNGETFDNVRAAVFGVMPHELGAFVLAKMGLPSAIQGPILEYLRSSSAANGSTIGPIAKALRLAEAMANGLMLANTPFATVCPVSCAECRDAIGTDMPVMLECASIRVGVLAQTSLLARLPRADEERLSGPMFPSTSLRVGYVRHPQFSSFDPLKAAMELLGTVETRDSVPEGAGISDKWDLMVIAVPESECPGYGLREIGRFRKVDSRSVPILYLSVNPPNALITRLPNVTTCRLPITLCSLSQLFIQYATALTTKREAA